MPLWSSGAVTDEPEFVLVSWGVYEVQLQAAGARTRHVAGEVGYGGAGQVSSPIVQFDAKSAAFRTKSGRVYRVRGSPGLGQEADYVWGAWLSRNPSHVPVRDVTDDVKTAIAQANGFEAYEDLRRALLRRKRPANPPLSGAR